MIYFRRTTAVKRQFLNYTLSIGAILEFRGAIGVRL